LLHRLILAQCSGFFEAGTSDEWSQAQAQAQLQPSRQVGRTSQERELTRIGEEDENGSQVDKSISNTGPGQRLFWRYELDPGNQEDEVPMLVQKVRSCAGTVDESC